MSHLLPLGGSFSRVGCDRHPPDRVTVTRNNAWALLLGTPAGHRSGRAQETQSPSRSSPTHVPTSLIKAGTVHLTVFLAQGVACQGDGTTVLPGGWDHLVV